MDENSIALSSIKQAPKDVIRTIRAGIAARREAERAILRDIRSAIYPAELNAAANDDQAPSADLEVPPSEPAPAHANEHPVTTLDGDLAGGLPPAAPTPRRVSKITQRRPRRSYTRSRESVVAIEGYVRDGRDPSRRPSVATPPPPSAPTPTPSSPSIETTTTKGRRADTRKPPAWRYTTIIEQSAVYCRTVGTLDRPGLRISLNFGGHVAKAANDNPKTFKRYIHDRLEKALKGSPLGARDFWFALEAAPSGRLHLHGAMDASPNEVQAVRDALAKAGGPWDSSRHAEHQVHADVMPCPDGWARYCIKDRARTSRLTGISNIVSVTRGCGRRGKELWEASRKRA